MKPIPTDDGFPHYDRRYVCETCCCGGPVHCLKGATRVGVASSILLTLSILYIAASGQFNFFWAAAMLWSAFCLLLLFSGLRCRNPYLLLPSLVNAVIGLGQTALMIIAFLYTVFNEESPAADLLKAQVNPRDLARLSHGELRNLIQMVSAFMVIFCALLGLLQYWLFDIVRRCYTYLKDYKNHRLRTGSAALDAQQVPILSAKDSSETPPPYSSV